jgi:hypothetical protein
MRSRYSAVRSDSRLRLPASLLAAPSLCATILSVVAVRTHSLTESEQCGQSLRCLVSSRTRWMSRPAFFALLRPSAVFEIDALTIAATESAEMEDRCATQYTHSLYRRVASYRTDGTGRKCSLRAVIIDMLCTRNYPVVATMANERYPPITLSPSLLNHSDSDDIFSSSCSAASILKLLSEED